MTAQTRSTVVGPIRFSTVALSRQRKTVVGRALTLRGFTSFVVSTADKRQKSHSVSRALEPTLHDLAPQWGSGERGVLEGVDSRQPDVGEEGVEGAEWG